MSKINKEKKVIRKEDFKQLIINSLAELDMLSQSAVALLLGTAAQESRLGTYLNQIGGGPALGPYQMEPTTERDIWHNYLAYRHELAQNIERVTGVNGPNPFHLRYNLIYATAMARLQYYRAPGPLPDAGDIAGLAEYWKQHYNTLAGAGTVGEFIRNYSRLID